MKKIAAFCALAALPFTVLAAGHGHAHWGYEGKAGAAHWGSLEPGFALCKDGKAQSPINIVTTQAAKAALTPIGIGYQATAGEVINNGHTIQVNLNDAGNASFGHSPYKLLQFHFHSPSEEQIDGKHFPMVAHFVHKNAEGKLAVVAVLFKQGKENTALKAVFNQLPAHEGDKVALASIDPAAVLPESLDYYGFEGSLTTPPCSEGVRWQVLKTPMELSAAQISAFKKLYKMNARPVQPLHGRKIQVSE